MPVAMSFAVIKTGGKQYKVAPGDILKVEKLPRLVGEQVTFTEVLLATDGQNLKIGTPNVAGAEVRAEVLEQGRAKKITVFKSTPKTRYRVKYGHRQPYTKIKILSLGF